MAEKINVTIRRSGAWVKSQRIARGENVPQDITVSVNPAELSERTRRLLIESFGDYRDIGPEIRCDNEYEVTKYSYAHVNYASCPIAFDSDDPTYADIDYAIAYCFDSFAQMKEQARKDKAAAIDAARKRAWAWANHSTESRRKEDRINYAIGQIDGRSPSDSELREHAPAQYYETRLAISEREATMLRERLNTLSKFAAEIPPDAIHLAAERIAEKTGDDADDVIEQAQTASAYLFTTDDE